MKVVIYARYSSHNQTEQSIEGQLKVCYEFAERFDYIVVEEYIDRAQSGTTDNRVEFQRMLADSEKGNFNAIIVYQLDRFARNRYDSAINKARLKRNGVRVLSARENITDDASGILIEGVLESMAEYYSVELAQKTRRGMEISASKCLHIGGKPGLGYIVDDEKRLQIDPATAPIVKEIFEKYANGYTVTEITKELNSRKIKTTKGNEFNKNSLHRMLRNRRYLGIYIYGGIETPGGVPRIIDDDLFERVQHQLERSARTAGRSKAKEEYLLTTKLFCGHCHEMMIGFSGTGKLGKLYHYYNCKNARKKMCDKKAVDKKLIENRVVQACFDQLNETNIEKLVDAAAAACKADYDTSQIKRLRKSLKDVDAAIENLWVALESGKSVYDITERLEKRKAEKAELESMIAFEENKQVYYTENQIRIFLYKLKQTGKDDERNRKSIINIFLNAIYLWDDKFTIVLNSGKHAVALEDIPLEEIIEDNMLVEGSPVKTSGLPSQTRFLIRIAGFLFFNTPVKCSPSFVL